MKLSVSVPERDVQFLDAYSASHGRTTRSAAIQDAIQALRLSALGDAYAEAFTEWDAIDEAAEWESTVGDRG